MTILALHSLTLRAKFVCVEEEQNCRSNHETGINVPRKRPHILSYITHTVSLAYEKTYSTTYYKDKILSLENTVVQAGFAASRFSK